jgi:hypothetical protein
MLDPSETTRKASGASSLVCGTEKPGGLRALLCGNLRIYGPPGPTIVTYYQHTPLAKPSSAAKLVTSLRAQCFVRGLFRSRAHPANGIHGIEHGRVPGALLIRASQNDAALIEAFEDSSEAAASHRH